MKKSVTYALFGLAICQSCFAQTSKTTESDTSLQASASTNESDTPYVSLGVSLWANSWEILSYGITPELLNPSDPSSPIVLRQHAQTTLSDTKIVPMPILGISWDGWNASASYYPRTSYDSKGAFSSPVTRSEMQLNVGYDLAELAVFKDHINKKSLYLSLGYKSDHTDKTTNSPTSSGAKISGGLLGISSTVPIGNNLSVYGNFAYGMGNDKLDSTLPDGSNKLDVTYRILEAGLSYSLYSPLSSASMIKDLSLRLGYRTQVAVIKDAPLATYSLNSPVPISIEKKNLQSTTDGFILSLVGTF
jgi:hypothetical protein